MAWYGWLIVGFFVGGPVWLILARQLAAVRASDCEQCRAALCAAGSDGLHDVAGGGWR